MKLNVKKLTEAIAELKTYAPLENSRGVKYLYDMLYTPMANGATFRICDLDFGAFTLDEVGEFEDYFDKTIYYHGNTACHVSGTLRKLPPMASKTRFI